MFCISETRNVQAGLYKDAIEGTLTADKLQEHKQYIDMDMKACKIINAVLALVFACRFKM